MSAVFAAKILGINSILFNVNNLAIPYDRIFSPVEKRIDRYIYKHVDYFITASKAAARKLCEVREIKEDKVINIYNTEKITK